MIGGLRPGLSVCLAVFASGCGGSGMADSDDTMDTEAFDGLSDAAILRIDVDPSGEISSDDPPLLPQSFEIVLSDGPVDLPMTPSVVVSGCVTGVEGTPWNPARLPGSTGPIEASITLRKPGTVMARTLGTDVDGCFSIDVVPALGYELTVVPSSVLVPFYGQLLDVVDDTTLDLDLGSGTSLWGTIVDGGGTPIPDVQVRLENEWGQLSASTFSAEDGSYRVQVTPGIYRLISYGRDSGRDPVLLSGAVEIEDEAVRVDVAYPSLQSHAVGGRMRETGGGEIGEAIVRFTSISLSGYPGSASLSIDVPADRFGNYDTRLVAGTYAVELIPGASSDLSPVALDSLTVTGAVDLGETMLPSLATIPGQVLDADGLAIPGAFVECREESFERRYFESLSDLAGTFELTASAVPLRCEITPPSVRPDLAQAVWTIDPSDEERFDVELPRGVPIDGFVHLDDEGLGYAFVEVRDVDESSLGATLTSDLDDRGVFSLRIVPSR